jgi:hypothetical protein
VSDSTVTVKEIEASDAASVSRFLNANLNPQVPVDRWLALLDPPWGSTGPNHGFQLVDANGRVVGAYIAVYSPMSRTAPPVCNLAAFCVEERHRGQSLTLLRALLQQHGFIFTDLSPSGSVPALNERLGFHYLDTTTRLVVNQPHWSTTFELTDVPADIEATLVGPDATIYRDHREAPAARHLIVRGGNDYAYLMYRRDRRKRLPFFAFPLYSGGNREVLKAGWRSVSNHLLAHRFLGTLAERRILGFTPPGVGRDLHRPRAKMARGQSPEGTSMDYLYSELTLLEW